MIIVNGFQPLTVITKHSILDVEAALDPPLVSLIFIQSSMEKDHLSIKKVVKTLRNQKKKKKKKKKNNNNNDKIKD